MKVSSTTVTRAGRISGKAIRVRICTSLAPSMRAASNIACGSRRKYCRKMITAVELIAETAGSSRGSCRALISGQGDVPTALNEAAEKVTSLAGRR